VKTFFYPALISLERQMANCHRILTNQLVNYANNLGTLDGMRNFALFEHAIKAGYQNAATEDELYRIYTDLVVTNDDLLKRIQEGARPIAEAIADSVFKYVENIVPWLNPVMMKKHQ
jgi:hypothetical protein